VSLPAGDFQDGWHSVVGTWDGTNRKLYLDGVLLDNVAGNGLNVTADQFVIGRTQSTIATSRAGSTNC